MSPSAWFIAASAFCFLIRRRLPPERFFLFRFCHNQRTPPWCRKIQPEVLCGGAWAENGCGRVLNLVLRNTGQARHLCRNPTSPNRIRHPNNRTRQDAYVTIQHRQIGPGTLPMSQLMLFKLRSQFVKQLLRARHLCHNPASPNRTRHLTSAIILFHVFALTNRAVAASSHCLMASATQLIIVASPPRSQFFTLRNCAILCMGPQESSSRSINPPSFFSKTRR